MDKTSSALLVTAFWTCFSFFKMVFIPLALYFGEKRMTIFNLLLMLTSVIIMVPHAAYNQLCIWISVILLGMGYSPLFAIAYSSLESHFTVTAKQTSIVFVTGVLGESIHPPLVGHFIDKNPNIFIYYLGATSLLFLITMFILPIICEKLFKNYKKSPSSYPSWEILTFMAMYAKNWINKPIDDLTIQLNFPINLDSVVKIIKIHNITPKLNTRKEFLRKFSPKDEMKIINIHRYHRSLAIN